MRRRHERVCGLKGRLGEKQAGRIKDDRKHESNKKADHCGVFDKIVREEGNAVLMLLMLEERQRFGRLVVSTKRGCRDTTPFDAEEMNPDQSQQDQRHADDVQGEETSQRLVADSRATTQELYQVIADHRDSSCRVSSHRGRPEGELAPGQEVTGQAEPHGQIQDGKAC